MRALVISDTHFGAWTGEDILRDPDTLALLEPRLDVDEVIFLGDMFDFLFGSLRDTFVAAGGLFDLMREQLQGNRFVFLAGNPDHHIVQREAEELVELELATGKSGEELRQAARTNDFFCRFLERRLEGVEIDIRYPTYTFGGVLCTHGHYLDCHARRSGAAPARLLAHTLWRIAVGGREHTPTSDDYEATIAILTGLLYTIAQLPNGTHAQRRVFAMFQTLERAIRLGAAPVRAVERVGELVASVVGSARDGRRSRLEVGMADYEAAVRQEGERRRCTGAPAGGEAASYAMARLVGPSDPAGPAVAAFEQAVMNLGWARDTDKIVFAHTHQPLRTYAAQAARSATGTPAPGSTSPTSAPTRPTLGT